MCRLAVYLGPDSNLQQIIFEANHSLEKQAWQPKELREAKLNADGFGIGWYNNEGKAARYRQTLPIWADVNLKDVCISIQRPLWLCYIRSATTGLGTNIDNTQPFYFESWQFLHNGYINSFQEQIRGKIRQLIEPDIEAIIQGSTDSEYLFALILHFFKKSKDMSAAIKVSFQQLSNWLGNERALLNIVFSDGVQIIATSFAINGECPSLYYGKDIEGFSKHSQLLVSEKLNDDPRWQKIQQQQLIRLRPDVAIEITPL